MQHSRANRRTSPRATGSASATTCIRALGPHSPLTGRSAGFTLVELLVAISILVVLTSLVVVGIQRDDDDRITSSARTLQSYVTGAQSRAIAEHRPSGMRLIPSQNDPFVVDSLQYIAASDYLVGTLSIVDEGGGRFLIANANAGEWPRLNIGGRSLIQPGQRIEIPAGTGNWYTIGWIEDLNDNGMLEANEDDQSSMTPMAPLDNNNGQLDFLINVFGVDWMSIRGHYSPSSWDAAAGTYTAQPSTGVPYRLELAPTILANSEPAQLDRGIVIDLHASQIPAAWRSGAPMDIMFDASGNPTGDFVAAGLIHLYLAAVSDVELTRARFVDHPVNGGSRSLPIVPAAFTAAGAEPIVPLVEPRVVTLYTQTGQVARSRIDFTDNFNNEPPFGAGMDFEADTPYSFAQRGREAK